MCILWGKINAQPILYVENPEYHGASSSFKCLSVRLTTSKTIITHRYTTSNTSDKYWINKGCYLQTYNSSRKYNLLYVKNAEYNKYDAKRVSGYSDFTQVFEPLPPNCTKFKYYEPDGSYETYDLSNYSGYRVVYSNNENYNFKRVADALSNLVSNNFETIKVGTELSSTLSKMRKIEFALNYPMLTFVCRFGSYSSEWAHEYRLNVNDAKIEEYAFDSGAHFYVINCGSGIIHNMLSTLYNCEDYISDQSNYYSSLIFNSDYSVLNRKIGNALLALIKTARDPNAAVSIDFDQAPSGIAITKKIIGNSNSASERTKKNSTKKIVNRSTNRVPALKKTK